MIRISLLIVVAGILFSCKTIKNDNQSLLVSDLNKMQTLKTEIEQQDSEALVFFNQLVADADKALTKGPFSVTYKTGMPPSGNKHDYLSLAPFFWPNPDTPDGLPYIRRDGEVNPETRDDYTDFRELRRFFDAVDVLGKAFFYSGQEEYANKAISLIRAWFIDPATLMNPHLNYGQGIPGHTEGRPFGIIEFGSIRNVLATLEILKYKNALDSNTEEGVRNWLYAYSDWLQTSELGVLESTRSNNHGTTYDAQLYNILLYLGEVDQVRTKMENITKDRIDSQIQPDGSQPHELQRTRAHSYSITNLAAFTRLAVLGKKVGVDLWNYESPDGGSIKKAYEYLIQYLVSDKEWEYQQISSMEESKIRFANLLLDAGKEFDDAEYVEIALRYLSGYKTDDGNKRIKPYHKNKSYWQYKGNPVYLLGGNKVVNPFQLEQQVLLHYMDELQASGGNYFRNVMSDREPGNMKAFKKAENGKYDLTQWNEDFWDGLRNMLQWSYERDIIVNLTFWDRFDHYDQIGHRDISREVLWINSPWNPVNNVNYTMEESGLDSTYAAHPITGINPFHQSVPEMKDLSVVLHFQQKFIEKILDLSLSYDNVIYNIGNEHQLDLMQWDMYWVQFVREYASAKGHEIETTAMFDHVIHEDGEWVGVDGFSPIIEDKEFFTFVEGSKVGSQWTDPGEAQYDAAIELIQHTNEVEIRPVNAVKVRTQNIVYNAQERLWRPLMAGFAALSHHRDYLEGLTPDGWPIGGLALTDMAKTNIQAMRIFTNLIVPWESVPRQDLLSDREEDEAYLLAKEGSMYGIYFPKGKGSVGLDMQNFQKSFIMRWVDIGNGKVVLETEIKGGNVLSIETPYDADFGWACAIVALD